MTSHAALATATPIGDAAPAYEPGVPSWVKAIASPVDDGVTKLPEAF